MVYFKRKVFPRVSSPRRPPSHDGWTRIHENTQARTRHVYVYVHVHVHGGSGSGTGGGTGAAEAAEAAAAAARLSACYGSVDIARTTRTECLDQVVRWEPRESIDYLSVRNIQAPNTRPVLNHLPVQYLPGALDCALRCLSGWDLLPSIFSRPAFHQLNHPRGLRSN